MKIEKNNQNFVLGILGGMGPMAGVELQRRIIAKSPGQSDAEHIKMICYTNPSIKDRTSSIKNGDNFSEDVIASLKVLEKMGASLGVIACNTAHAEYQDIIKRINIPLLNIIELTVSSIVDNFCDIKKVGVLATDGTLLSGLYKNELNKYGLEEIVLDKDEQAQLMNLIYGEEGIKAGFINTSGNLSLLNHLIEKLHKKGATKIVLACTELSLLSLTNTTIVDPMNVIAENVLSINSKNIKNML